MLIPLIFMVGLAILGMKAGQQKKPGKSYGWQDMPKPITAGQVPSAVDQLNLALSRGEEPSPWLVSEATREAYERGDWETVAAISDLFDQDEEVATSEEQPASEEQTEENEPPDVESPLDNVAKEDWQAFVDALSTKDQTNKTERHVGRYEQSISRLKSLGIEIPTDDKSQYAALTADMLDYWNSEDKLIQDYAGEAVNIKGADHAVTPSGVLGLLKAAGHQGARGWLDNPEDREKFPHTTATFIKTNGCF